MAVIWLNGLLIPEEKACVSIFDRGYLYGDGLFETMRAYHGNVFRLLQHLHRLAAGVAAIGISLPLELREFDSIIAETLQANTLSDAYIRLTVSRGVYLGPVPPSDLTATISVIARPLKLPPAEDYARGWRALSVPSSLAPGAALSRLKPLSYLDKLMAKATARDAGVEEAVLVDCTGEVTEASTSNVFLVRDGVIHTPPESAGLLAGITRAAVIDCAREKSLELVETRVIPSDVASADECFLTNSIVEIMPLVEFNGHAIGSGRPGAVTQMLRKAYATLVEREVGNVEP